MKWLFLFTVSLIILPGCNLQQREKELNRRSEELNKREQQLLVKETALTLKEEELNKRERLLDSTMKNGTADDSAGQYNAMIVGLWTVRMYCTETNCAGSAIGDTRTEQWEISFQDGSIVAKAMSDSKLIRIYTGTFQNDMLRLTSSHEDLPSKKVTNMIVRLQVMNPGVMEGQREIQRPENCRIIYGLELKKQ
jgi:hypothetical protein